MADTGKNREMVQRAVNDVLAAALPRLRDDVTEHVLRQLGPALASQNADGDMGRLRLAVAAIYEAATQGDVLTALLDGAAAFSARTGLFVVRGTSSAGWQARGFRDNDAIKALTLDLNLGLVAQAIQQRLPVAGSSTQFDAKVLTTLGPPNDGNCHVVPLVIRERVAAILYLDAGTQAAGTSDSAAIEVLVRTAGTWLELLALRKSAGAPSPASPMQPSGIATAASSGPPSTGGLASAPGYPTVESANGGSDDELHRRARRFAKLLVDEIKLYNDAKVKEGKQHRDLYDRLKDDIDKSRASFDQRFANTAAGNYFSQELIRNLADNDSTLLGSNFRP